MITYQITDVYNRISDVKATSEWNALQKFITKTGFICADVLSVIEVDPERDS